MRDLGLLAAMPFLLLLFFLDRIILVFCPFVTGVSLSKWWLDERIMLKSIWRVFIFILILCVLDLIYHVFEGNVSF